MRFRLSLFDSLTFLVLLMAGIAAVAQDSIVLSAPERPRVPIAKGTVGLAAKR